MELRFQENDEVDRESKGERPAIIVVGVLIAVIMGVTAWIDGESLHSYGKEFAIEVAFIWAMWILYPIYSEFRIRTKEIYGNVARMSERLEAVEAEMRRREV